MSEKKRKLITTTAKEWLTEDRLLLLRSWARDMSLKDVARKIGIVPKTLSDWRNKYPEIDEALRKGSEIVDYEVENALLKRALGYKVTETKTIIGQPGKDGNRPIRIEKVEKEIPPDVTAIFGWLNNRKPDQWKRNRDNVVELNDKESNITVNIVRSKGNEEKEQEDDNDDWDSVLEEYGDEDWEE